MNDPAASGRGEPPFACARDFLPQLSCPGGVRAI